MKTLVLAAAFPFLHVAVQAQEIQAQPVPETRQESPGEKKDQPLTYLGIIMQSGDAGVRVAHVHKNTPAENAGLEVGAVITGIDGKAVEAEPSVVADAIRAKKPGDEIELQWRVENGDKIARIKLGSRTAMEMRAEMDELNRFSDGAKERLRELKLKEVAPGVEVDPYKVPLKEKQLRIQPPWERRDFDLEVPLRDLEGGGLKLRGKFEDGRAEAKTPGAALRQEKGQDEKAIWDSVEKRVAGALDKSDLDAGVKEKVMKALEEARRGEVQQDLRRKELEAEIDKLEKMARTLQERTEKLRNELKESPK